MASPTQRPGTAPDAASLLQMAFSFAPTRILQSALELGAFDQIAAGRRTAAEVANAASAKERGTRMLLDSLVSLQLLTKRDGHYDLAPVAAEHLVRGRPGYMGSVIEARLNERGWQNLTDTIRTGTPVQHAESQQDAEEFFPVLVRSLHVINMPFARRLASALGAGTTHSGLKVLDIACGSGVWGIAVAEADQRATVTAQDYPRMLEIARDHAKRHRVENRVEYLPGDLKEVAFGENRYDVAILGNIVHSEGERSSRDLFRRIRPALRPGGRIAVIDMVPNDARTGPPFPIFFALQMLLNTTEGDTYTLTQYTRWLTEAGFRQVETADLGSHSPAIIAQ